MDFLSDEWFEEMKDRTGQRLSRPGKVKRNAGSTVWSGTASFRI